MKDSAELIATFRPTIEAIREEIDAGIGDSRAMELEIDLTVELRRFDLEAQAVGEPAEIEAFRDEIKALLQRLAKGRGTTTKV